jgi:hypothetical protein
VFQRKPRRKNPPIQRTGSSGFPEGLNTLAHPSTLKDTELSELINGMYSQYGTISKRPGTTVIGQTATGGTQISQLIATYNIAGASHFIRISDSGIPEYYNYNTNLWVALSATAPSGYSGDNPTFTDGTPTFNTTVITWIRQIGDRLYFANSVNELVWLDEDGWHIYTALDDPTAYPTIAKTGSGTGTTKWYYQYVWWNEAGPTLASPPADSAVQTTGTGWIGAMPQSLDNDTFLTITLPTAPAGCTKVSIFRSNRQGEAFYLDTIDPSQTTYADKGELGTDTFYGVPSANSTGGYHFKLLDVYMGSLVGVATELGDDTLVWGGFTEKYGSFSLDDGAGFLPYHRGDGRGISAIKVHVASSESSLFIFKDNCFGKFKFIGDEDVGGVIQDVNMAVGSISPLSPHTAGNNLRFWSRDGAATVGNEANYGTILRYSVLSLRADAIVDRVTAANMDKVCGEFYKSHSLFGISTDVAGGGNNAILAYDERYNAWSLWSGVYPKIFAKAIHPTTKEEKLYYGSSNTADVLEMWNGKTDYKTSTGSGTRITLSISTKQYDIKLPDQFKRFDKATLVFGTLTGNNTTVGVIRANHKGIRSDPRLRISQEAVLSGFGSDEWGNQEFGMMNNNEAGESVNLRYINLKQKDLFWVKINIQNDGVEDEIDLIGIYLYYSQSSRPLTFGMKLRQLASA